MKDLLPRFLLDPPSVVKPMRKGNLSSSFADQAIGHLSRFIRTSYFQWETASREGLIQKLDARVKISFLVFFVVAVSLKTSILSQLVFGAFLMGLAASSRLPLGHFYSRILFLASVFGFLIPLPSALNLFTPGETIVPLLRLSKSHTLWVYHLPAVIGITREGLYGILILTCRIFNSLSVTFLVLYTTPFPEIIRGLRVFRIPETALLVIILTHKYVFLFVSGVEEMYLARKARFAGTERRAEARSWAADRIALTFRRSQMRFEQVYKAMVARAFSGTVPPVRFRRLGVFDLLTASLLLGAGILFLSL